MVAVAHGTGSANTNEVEPAIDSALKQFQEQLKKLTRVETLAVILAATRALEELAEPVSPAVALLTGNQTFSPEERVRAEVTVLVRSFERRRELLAGALTASQVATLLGTSRQTPHDRVKSGTLLAVMDRGALRFPPWQFDPDGADSIVNGLPIIIRALAVSPIAKVSWLTRPNVMLDNVTPLAILQGGQVDRVATLARAVGVT